MIKDCKTKVKNWIKAFQPARPIDLKPLSDQLNELVQQLATASDQLEHVQNQLRYLKLLALRNNQRQATYFGANRTASWNLDNLFFVVNVPDFGFPANLIRDSAYEEVNYQITQYLWDWERPFLDIGANCGIFAARLGNLTRRIPTQIFAFEPNPEMHELCEINFFNNGLNHCYAIQNAASNTFSPASLWVSPRHSGGASIDSNGSQGEERGSGNQLERKVEIQCITIDSFLQKKDIQKPSFAKIDVEHHEGQVLEGMDLTLTTMANDTETFGIIFECLEGIMPKIMSAMVAKAIDQGYGLFHIASRTNLTRISLEDIKSFPGYLLLLNKALVANKLQPQLNNTNASGYAANRLEIPLAAMLTTSRSTRNREESGQEPNEICYQIPDHEHSSLHLIAHGPYCSLHPGNYRLKIEFQATQTINVQLQHDLSQRINSQLCPDGSWLFNLEHYTNNFEILLFAASGDQGTIQRISIIDETMI